MMPLFRRRSTQKPATKKHTARPFVPASDVVGVRLKHLDYNLQPLNVESLSHYIEPIVEDVRFRVH